MISSVDIPSKSIVSRARLNLAEVFIPSIFTTINNAIIIIETRELMGHVDSKG
jgi:hypothetical protein